MTTIYESLSAARVVPVVVIEDAARAVDLAEALIAGGIRAVEVTLRTPAGRDAMAAIAAHGGLTVGAGTVLTRDQVDSCAAAGARFIVSPGVDDEVIARALELGLGVVPGVATATEVQRAMRSGLSALKLFPADRVGGIAMIDALNGPFPGIRFMPSGGVTPANAAEYLAHPSVFAISGSWMATRSAIASGDFSAIRDASAAAMDLAR